MQVDGSRAFKRSYVPHEDDVVALTKRYVCDKAGLGRFSGTRAEIVLLDFSAVDSFCLALESRAGRTSRGSQCWCYLMAVILLCNPWCR